MDRSPGFGSTACNFRPFRLDFSTAPMLQHLNLAAYHNSLARSTKSTWSLIAPIACKHKVSGSFSLPSRGPFHLSLTVLFTIGHWVVFRLGGWAPRLQTGFHVSGPTLVSSDQFSLSHTGALPCFPQLSSCLLLEFPVPYDDPQPRQ